MTSSHFTTFLILFYLPSYLIQLCTQDMPMNSPSEQAISEVRADIMGHDMGNFESYMDCTLEHDPHMLMARFFKAADPDGNAESAAPYVAKLQAYHDPLSEGEQLFLEMLSHLPEENYHPAADLEELEVKE